MFDAFSHSDTPSGGKSWPEHVPEDLSLRLRDALSYSDCNAADVWEEIRLWLEGHGVSAPEHVTSTQDGRDFRPGGSVKYSLHP